MYAIERSCPKVGVGQILKQYLEYLSSYIHFSKLKRSTKTWVKMTKCDLTLTYIEGLTWGLGCIILKGLTLR